MDKPTALPGVLKEVQPKLGFADALTNYLRRYGSFLLLAFVLLLHFGLRYCVNDSLPLDARHFYPALYSIALSLTGESGLKVFGLDDKLAAHAPVIRFLNLKQASLTAREFSAFMASRPATGPVSAAAENRLFEFRVASWLWRSLGISWSVLTIFYIIVSTFSCLCIFFICRHLTGLQWCGLLGAALFAVMPCEMGHSIWSIRDANPTWFTILALTFCLCVAGRFYSLWANAFSYFLLGIISLIGLGWRSDAILIPGLTFLGLLTVLRRRHRQWKHVILAVLTFVSGTVLVYVVLSVQIVTKEDFSPAWMTHIAVYADEARANICQYEKSYQVFFDDATVAANVYRWLNKEVPYLGADYARACTKMLQDEASYNIFNWIDLFPRLWGQKIWEGCGDSYGSYHLIPWRKADSTYGIRSVLGTMHNLMRRFWIVLILAFAGAFFFSPYPLEALLLAFFSVYYTALYWVMLPMEKHITPMSLPAAVALAFAGCAIIAPCTAAGRSAAVRSMKRRWKSGLILLILSSCIFVVVREAARAHSTSVRITYLTEIQRRFSEGLSFGESIKDPQKASLCFPAGILKKDRGYCWRIHSDGQGGVLTLWTRRPSISSRSLFAIPKGQREVFFYSTCTQFLVPSVVDGALDVVITLPAGARFDSCRSFDLDGWKTLPFSTVFYSGETTPGSPRIGSEGAPVSAIGIPSVGWEKLLSRP